MKLEALIKEELELVRGWRNEEMQFLRTPYFLTKEMQEDFYRDVVCNRQSEHRYFSVREDSKFIGMVGLTTIEWENRTAEVSIILNPKYRGKGYGQKSVELLLDHAFNNMGLYTVWGEVYGCGNIGFWDKMVDRLSGYSTHLPNRKKYNGVLWYSLWFQFANKGKK